MKSIGINWQAFLLLVAVALVAGGDLRAQKPDPGAPASAPANALAKDDDQAVRKVVMSFVEAWNTHDMKALAQMFREDAEWINIVGMHWHGREAIVAATTAFHETMFKNHRTKIDAVETRSLGNGVAVAVATITVDGFTTPGGQVMPKAQDRETFVLVKGPDGWTIAHGHNVVIDANAAQHDPVNRPRK